MDSEDLSTVDAELTQLAPTATFLELRILDREGVRQLPFLEKKLEFNLNGKSGTLTLCDSGGLQLRWGESVRDIRVAEKFDLEDGQLEVVDLRALPPYWLEGLSPEIQGRRWAVRYGEHQVGRKGSRVNQIQLGHRSISRSHATLLVNSTTALIKADSGALTAVQGVRVDKEKSAILESNSLLQLGEWHFRWTKEERSLLYRPGLLRLKGFGSEGTWIDERKVTWHHGKARDLLFWLAYCRSSLAVERVVEEYWPERPRTRQRKNLSHVLKGLQAELGLSTESLNDLVERTPDTLKLNPERVQDCDFWSLVGGEPSRWDALEGPFLPTNERPWARAARRDLFVSWLSQVERSIGSEQDREQALELTGRQLKQGDFDLFVYERASTFAKNLGAETHAKSWLKACEEL